MLSSMGLSVDVGAVLAVAQEFRRLSSTWNLAAKLMSARDLQRRFDEHLADSMTLGLFVEEAALSGSKYVDLGSGGGFPAIPLGFVIPSLSATLVERSAAKADFLRHALSRLGLTRFRVLQASYPCAGLPDEPRVYTARATEKPVMLDREILNRLRPGDVYMAQREVELDAAHTELRMTLVEDAFTATGLRRGRLYKISR